MLTNTKSRRVVGDLILNSNVADIPQGHTGDHPIFTLWVMDNMQRNVWIYIEFNLCIIMTCYLVMKQVSPWTWLRLCFNIINQLLNRQYIWKPLGKCSFYLINPWKQFSLQRRSQSFVGMVIWWGPRKSHDNLCKIQSYLRVRKTDFWSFFEALEINILMYEEKNTVCTI